MALDSGSVGAAAAAVGVPLVMAGLARLFPAAAPPVATATLDELRVRYRALELGLGVAGLALAVPTGFACWYALRALAALHAAMAPPAEIAWVADPYYWAMPAIILGIAAMLPASDWAARRRLGERHAEYQAYLQLKTGMDLARVARLLGWATALGCALFVFLGLDWSVRAGPEGLAVNRYLSIGAERHDWSDVRAIRTAPALVAPNGNLVRRREYVLRFADGASWSTNNLLAQPSADEKRRLVELAAARSGVAVEEVELLRNEEL